MSNHAVKFSVELEPFLAYALAELCKRIGYQECRNNSVSQDEAYYMLHAMDQVRLALEKKGVVVR
jgi:hypothetical protein